MDPGFGLALFACSGPGAPISQAKNFTDPLADAVVVGILACLSFRRWREGRGSVCVPTLCGALLAFHPAWTVTGGGGDCASAKALESLFVTMLAGACVAAPWLMHRTSFRRADIPGERPAVPPDARTCAAQPCSLPEDPAPRTGESAPKISALWQTFCDFVDAVVSRAFAAMAVGLFAYVQYLLFMPRPQFARSPTGWWALRPVYFLAHIEPDDDWGNWALGPLYFLRNASPADDWIGYALLAVAVPCLLSVVLWPNRRTALAASLTAWAWVIPGTVRALFFV
jgi:hypothetical protein